MSTLPSLMNELRAAEPSWQVLIVEAAAGAPRRRWLADRLQEMSLSGARTFNVCCDFDLGGPWAGVSALFSGLIAEIQAQRPDLIDLHALELVYALPPLRRCVTVRNPNLTDMAPASERTRNYAADRAFRTIHGLIDLLDSWKSVHCPEAPWVIASDGFDAAGAMSSVFFKELLRRRGERLNIRLLATVAPGNGDAARTVLSTAGPAEAISVDLPADPPAAIEAPAAARLASELEERIGNDRVELQTHLSDLIRLWGAAGRPDKVLRYRTIGLTTYNTLGLYEDALRYGKGLPALAAQYAPDDEELRWTIVLKMLMSHIGLSDVKSAMTLADEEGLKLVEHHPEWRVSLFYLIAMFHARFLKPRDLAKGEEYLELAQTAIEQAGLPEEERHFFSVFNRNGLAMIRNFQGRHQEAIELCRSGIARLNEHLAADQHRLHRSILVYNIAQVYAATGKPAEALEYYSATIAMDPNYSEYYNERGSLYLNLGRLEEALSDYVRAIELSPPYFEVFTNLGQCYRRMGAMTDAIESYSRALDLEPHHVLALVGRAKSHEEMGQIREAIADYTAALAQDPKQWEAVASRGVMYYEAGELEASLADFNRAIELKHDQADLYQNRATVLTGLGRYEDAARNLQSALLLQPGEDDRLEIQARLESALLASTAAMTAEHARSLTV